jgi:hypothetical protein
MSKDIREKLADAAKGEYVCENPVTVSEDCLRSIAEVNYRRGQEHERQRCMEIVAAHECEETSRCRCNVQMAVKIIGKDAPQTQRPN